MLSEKKRNIRTVIGGMETIKAAKSGPGLTAGKRQDDVFS
jgi:hypothetical protein